MTRIIPFDSIKPVQWQRRGELPYPRLVTYVDSCYVSADGQQIESNTFMYTGYDPYDRYVSNCFFILSGPDGVVPGYGEYANEQRYSRGEIDPKNGGEITMRLYDFDIFVLGNTDVIKALLDRFPSFRMPEFIVSADSPEADLWLKTVFSFIVFKDKLWGGGKLIRRLRLRKSTADYDVLVQIENPEAATYQTAAWTTVNEETISPPPGPSRRVDWISTSGTNRSGNIISTYNRRPE